MCFSRNLCFLVCFNYFFGLICQEEKESKSSEKLRSKRGVNGRAQKEKEAKRVKFEEPPKGVIHVRARRGEATDSHSLAERVINIIYIYLRICLFIFADDNINYLELCRPYIWKFVQVRREKISEKMRILQNLVPGCDKVRGIYVKLHFCWMRIFD